MQMCYRYVTVMLVLCYLYTQRDMIGSRRKRAESREQRAESREQRAESREQRAESREQRADLLLVITLYEVLVPEALQGGAGESQDLRERIGINGRVRFWREKEKACREGQGKA
jgi:hypothetical protein